MSAEVPAPRFQVAIVGGGIAGLTLALGLLSRNVSVTVYERSAGLREIGAGIGFTANAERAMDAINPQIREAFGKVRVQNGTDWFNWVDGVGEPNSDGEDRVIQKLYLGERGFEGCHRADFLDELAKLMPESVVKFGRNLVRIDDDESDGPVRLTFADGSMETADAVIGCDGIRSRVKQLLLGAENPASHPTYSHKYAFRGLVPMAQAEAVLGNAKTQSRHMYLGLDSHVLTFPVACGQLLNVVGFATDPSPWPITDKFTAPASKVDAVTAFAACNSTVRSIIALLPDVLDKWAVFDTFDQPPSTYIKGRVCLAGDAAHAAAPYHGAGAGFAIEDGAVLAELMSAAANSPTKAGTVAAALQAYEDVRLERAQWLVESSRTVGKMYQGQDENVGKDLIKCADEIEWRSKRIWDYDVAQMVVQANERFAELLQKV